MNQTMVSNATLHNYEFINEMKINEGDEVLVIKSWNNSKSNWFS
ncbi:hypothetical protein [Mycoplasmopsis felis]